MAARVLEKGREGLIDGTIDQLWGDGLGVRAIPIVAQRKIAVVTEDTESCWISLSLQPLIKHLPLPNDSSMFISSTADVIDGQELYTVFSAAGTRPSILIEKISPSFHPTGLLVDFDLIRIFSTPSPIRLSLPGSMLGGVDGCECVAAGLTPRLEAIIPTTVGVKLSDEARLLALRADSRAGSAAGSVNSFPADSPCFVHDGIITYEYSSIKKGDI